MSSVKSGQLGFPVAPRIGNRVRQDQGCFDAQQIIQVSQLSKPLSLYIESDSLDFVFLLTLQADVGISWFPLSGKRSESRLQRVDDQSDTSMLKTTLQL